MRPNEQAKSTGLEETVTDASDTLMTSGAMTSGDPAQASLKPKVLLLGASGTIGRAVAKQLKSQGFDLTMLLRHNDSGYETRDLPELKGSNLIFDDENFAGSVDFALRLKRCDCVISCIASPTGTAEDAEQVDYQANSTALKIAQDRGVSHFILLSAICVQKPKLAFQQAKLKFESELQASDITWTIVRPTAFFKSLSGQIDRVRKGKPFLMFGNGELTRCKPISDSDLARYIVGCIEDKGRHNKILPIGGPGPAISPKEQGEMLFELAGKEPRFRCVSAGMFDLVIGLLTPLAWVSKWGAEKREYARIGKYYATESMLVWDEESGQYNADATPEYGSETLFDHYAEQIEKRG